MEDVDFQDALGDVMDDVIPRSGGRRRRQPSQSYYVEEDKDVRVGRPLYSGSTFTRGVMMDVERNDPDNIRRRRMAEAELEYDTRRKELMLERRDVIFDSLKKKAELEAADISRIRENRIYSDGMGFLADLADLEERNEVSWPAVQQLQQKYKSAHQHPLVGDSLKALDPMREEYERQQEITRQQEDANRKMQEAAGLTAGTLGRGERTFYDDQISRGTAPATALSAIERRRAYEEAYDKFAESGVPTDLLDSITVGDPETGEVGFDQKSLRKLRTGLSVMAQKATKIEAIEKDIKAIQEDAKNPTTGMVSFTPAQTEALTLLREARAELVKERLQAEKQLLGPSKATEAQSSAADLLDRALGGNSNTDNAAPAAQDQRSQQFGP